MTMVKEHMRRFLWEGFYVIYIRTTYTSICTYESQRQRSDGQKDLGEVRPKVTPEGLPVYMTGRVTKVVGTKEIC